jgi:type IV pilus assembly protein PilC
VTYLAEERSAYALGLDQPSTEPPPLPVKTKSALKRVMSFEITPKKVKRKDLMHFSRQMASFLVAGVPILEAIDSITEEMSNKFFKALLGEIREDLAGGTSFADAVAKHSDAFPGFYLGLLRTAELTGTLDDALQRLAEYIERDLEARRKVSSALLYPGIILVMSIVVVAVLTLYVLPKFKTFFSDFGAKLPLATRILLDTSNFISSHTYIIYAVLIVPIVVLLWFAGSKSGRAARDRIVLKVPVLGDLVRHAVLERFCRVLSAMVTAGVPMPEALSVSSEATNNVVFRRGLQNALGAVMRGEGFAQPMAETGLFPAAARQMMRVGENAGVLDQQLEIAAGYFDRELDYKLKRFTTLFEPAVIVLMGLIVGFVAIALVSAMYGIYHQVNV